MQTVVVGKLHLKNFSLVRNRNVVRASNVLDKVLKKLIDEKFLWINGFTVGFDEDTGDVLIFLPLYELYEFYEEEQKEFLETLKKEWIDAQFEILEDCEISGDVYFHVGFASHFFRLKSLI